MNDPTYYYAISIPFATIRIIAAVSAGILYFGNQGGQNVRDILSALRLTSRLLYIRQDSDQPDSKVIAHFQTIYFYCHAAQALHGTTS